MNPSLVTGQSQRQLSFKPQKQIFIQLQYNKLYLNQLENHILMKLLICCLLIFFNTFAQRIPQEGIPQTFGLNTVTYARAGNNSQFEKYLSRYAFMDCPIVTQINIVWNNQKTPEQMGVFKNSQKWKRPINFFKTPHNSMNWRYKTAQKSEALVFFSIDDDIVISCQQLTKGFRIWQANAVGSVGPIIAYRSRHFSYTKDIGLKYQLQKGQFFNFGLISFSFMSLHFMQLYYANIWEVQQMRKMVIDKENCDDIALEWVAQYFYPQFPTIVIEGSVKDIAPAVGQSTAPQHYIKRDDCLNEFTRIFGSLVLKHKPIQDKYSNVKRWTFPFANSSTILKKQYLDRQILHKDPNQKTTPLQYSLKPYVQGEQQKNKQKQKQYEKQLAQDKQLIAQLKAKVAEAAITQAELKQKLKEAAQNQKDLAHKNNQLQEEISGYKLLLSQPKKQGLVGTSLTSNSNPKPDSNSGLTLSQKQRQILFYSLVVLITVVAILVAKRLLSKKQRGQQPDWHQRSRMAVSPLAQRMGSASGLPRRNLQ